MLFLPFIYIIFFLSGAAGLMYQIVWTRMLLLIFGSTTHSVVAVVSAFMAGLAIGSYSAPKVFKRHIHLLQLYGLLELGIGMSALLTLFLFPVVSHVYSFIYQVGVGRELLLISKFILTFIVLLPATTLMGATLPLLVTVLTGDLRRVPSRTVSMLYAVNTFGAFVGVLATGFVFIEILGLTKTLILAASVNILIGFFIYLFHGLKLLHRVKKSTQNVTASYTPDRVKLSLFIFTFSGMLSMAYEIAWTRQLTPITGTYIYAFSFILALILLGIAIGSFIARFADRIARPLTLMSMCQLGIGLGAFASVVASSSLVNFSPLFTQLFVLLPATISMGIVFPIITNLAKYQDMSQFVGTSYALNTIGSMVGPFLAAFVLLPTLGATNTILFLSVINLLFAIVLAYREQQHRHGIVRASIMVISASTIITIVVLSSSRSGLLREKSLALHLATFAKGGYAYFYKEDETAAVLGYKNSTGSDYGLLVDGVGMSVLVDETKLMAHLPLLLHPNPKDVLVIAFGMGTTFRSALSHNVNVDAVELVPSVPDAFPIFFNDAALVRSNPKGHVIINDGRNYIRMTKKKYDIITIDPPPPVNSAGTTVLYSREFYQQSLKRLNNGGIVSQWFFYGTRVDDFQMLIKSFIDVFPYVAVFRSPRDIGIYALGSNKPIVIDKDHIADVFQRTPAIVKDLNEWGYWNQNNLVSLYAGDKEELKKFAGNAYPVTDDHPRTEYFLLRQRSTFSDIARNEALFH